MSGNDILTLQGDFTGKLNNFEFKKLNLSSKKGLNIKGDLFFVNSVNTERGFIFEGDLDNISANYKKLRIVLPNVLGKNLPSEFDKLGNFALKGYIKVTPEQIQADVELKSEIGSAISNLSILNIDDIDYATYDGEIKFDNFDIGEFFNNPNIWKTFFNR